MKMRKRSPLIPLGMQRKLLCANVFHDMEIRYVDIFASNRYAALKVRGCDPGGRVLRGRILADIYRTGSCPPFELKFVSLEDLSP